MPFAFKAYEPSEVGSVERWDVPLNDWLGLKFSQGVNDTAFGAISRFTEDQIWDEGPTMHQDVANLKFGIPGQLVFNEPVTIQRARLMRERKDEELRRTAYFNSASHGYLTAKAALGTLASMAGSVANPLDFSLMFVPIVGSEAGIAKLGTGATRLERFAAKGFVTGESLSSRIPHFSAAVINGTVGNAITEIPLFIQNTRDQSDYKLEDAVSNVLMGGIFGGILHAGIKGLGKAIELSGKAIKTASPVANEMALRENINALATDEPMNGHLFLSTDEKVVAESLRKSEPFDEATAMARAKEVITEPNSLIKDAELELMARKEAAGIELSEAEIAKTVEAMSKDPKFEQVFGERVDQLRGGPQTEQVANELARRQNSFVDAQRVKHAESINKKAATLVQSVMDSLKQLPDRLTESQIKDVADRSSFDERAMSLLKDDVATLEKEVLAEKPKAVEGKEPAPESDAEVEFRSIAQKALAAEKKSISKAYDAALACLTKL